MKQFFLILIIFIVFGCKKEDPELKLIYPLESDVVPLNGLNFEWKNTFSDVSYITISEDESFTATKAHDTIIGVNNFTYSSLKPSRTYYWKIRDPSSEIIESSSFMIKDYLSDYEGVITMNTKEFNEGIPYNQPIPDNWFDPIYYDSEIVLEKWESIDSYNNPTNGFLIQADSTFIPNISQSGKIYHKSSTFNTEENRLIFHGGYSWNSNYFSTLEIDVVTDSIFFSLSKGGLAGPWRNWKMEGKYE